MPPTTSDPAVDMTPDALRRRLEQLRALYRLMCYLRTARPVDPP